MISYDDARQIREKANAPLTWDETIPAPPIDRIELTRRILETAETVGLEFPAWDESFLYSDPEKKTDRFQKRLRRFIPKQSIKGIPMKAVRWCNNGLMWQGTSALEGGEYIAGLEEDYFKPWETSWRYGVCIGSKESVLLLMEEAVAHEVRGNSKYPDSENKKDEIIATRFGNVFGLSLSSHLRWYAGVDPTLVEGQWLGLCESWVLSLPLVIGLFCLAGVILGVVQTHYSGWLLFAAIPAILAGALIARTKIFDRIKSRWVNPKMTFDELAEKVVALKKREWAELKQTYTTQ